MNSSSKSILLPKGSSYLVRENLFWVTEKSRKSRLMFVSDECSQIFLLLRFKVFRAISGYFVVISLAFKDTETSQYC